jgi:hypothetical protein
MKGRWICVLLAIASHSALGCQCAQSSLAERYAKASIVFVGATTASPAKPGKFGQTITFQVSRSLKGGFLAGSKVVIDPLFGTDCSAPFVAGAQLLLFAFTQPGHTPIVSACSIHTTEPISIDGQLIKPSPDVLEFLQSFGKGGG